MDDGAADGWLLKRESARVSRGCQGSAIAPNKFEHAPPRASGSTMHNISRHIMEPTIRSELSSELTRIIECHYPASLSVSMPPLLQQ